MQEGVNAAHNMNEMQCMWFANEAAYAHFAKGDYGEALKKCHEVDRVGGRVYCMWSTVLAAHDRDGGRPVRLPHVLRAQDDAHVVRQVAATRGHDTVSGLDYGSFT